MGIIYIQHSDMCGCSRCAREADKENPRPVYEKVDDPDYLDCGCSVFSSCNCAQYDSD